MIFDLVFFVYAFCYLPYLLITGRWYKGFGMRFGFFPAFLKSRLSSFSNVWIHAVSVGEVMAISGLISKIKSNRKRTIPFNKLPIKTRFTKQYTL